MIIDSKILLLHDEQNLYKILNKITKGVNCCEKLWRRIDMDSDLLRENQMDQLVSTNFENY